jgi:hypothetical protein
MKKRQFVGLLGAAAAITVVGTHSLPTHAAAETMKMADYTHHKEDHMGGEHDDVSATVTGTVEQINTDPPTLRVSEGTQKFDIRVRTKAAVLNGIKVGDTVVVTGFEHPPEFFGDPMELMAETLKDNGKDIALKADRGATVTYTDAKVTAINSQGNSARIMVNGKVVDIRLGKVIKKNPVIVGDSLTITGNEMEGAFSDSPSQLMPTSLSINGTTVTLPMAKMMRP